MSGEAGLRHSVLSIQHSRSRGARSAERRLDCASHSLVNMPRRDIYRGRRRHGVRSTPVILFNAAVAVPLRHRPTQRVL